MARTTLLGTSVIALALFGCSQQTLKTEETDVVVTVENPDADYRDFKTYALTDEVTDLCSADLPEGPGGGPGIGAGGGFDGGEDLSCASFPDALDAVVLGSIERNMDALGYERVERGDDPDVVVVVGSVVRNEWYYSNGYYWCDPYYWYYCWYEPGGVYYAFSRGSILINMLDASAAPQATSVWFVGLDALYEASENVSGSDRVELMVNRAFEQSPYLADGGAQ